MTAITFPATRPTDRVMKKGCQENKPKMKQGRVNRLCGLCHRDLTVGRLTGTWPRHDCYKHSEGDADEVGQRRGSCSGVAVDPRLGLCLLVVNHD